jgi:branched-chain amino acid aminotransferase
MAARKKELQVYVNGKFYPESKAVVSIFDHGLLYGDGVYDTMCSWNFSIFRLEEHVDRLYRSAHAVKLKIPLTKKKFAETIVETVRRSGLRNAYIKCVVTRGVGPQPLLDPRGCKTTVVIFCRPYMWLAGSSKGEGLRCKITSVRQIPNDSLSRKVKNLNYLNFVLAKIEAIETGFDNALMPNQTGDVLEGPGLNLFLVKEGELITPPAEEILEGITRAAVFEIADELGIPVWTERISSYDCYTADEAFFCSTAGGVVPIVDIDGRKIGTGRMGRISKLIEKTYFEWLESGRDGTSVRR